MLGNTPVVEIEVVWDGDICPYCGQERPGNIQYCNMCSKQMTSFILAICRDLLYSTGQTKQLDKKLKEDLGTEKDAVQEMEIFNVISKFPYNFAQRCQKFPKALNSEGVWFSHMVAYRFIDTMRAEKNLSPPMLVCDPMYQMVRDQVFEFLQNPSPDEQECEAFENVYNIPESRDDGAAVIHLMIEELERIKRLTISRSKTKCQGCGKELTTGKTKCEDCLKDEALDNRRSISSGTVAPLTQPQADSGPVSSRPSGMHIHEK